MSDTLRTAIETEVKLLNQKVELLKLRVDEAGNTQRAEYIRLIGRELWQCSERLKKALSQAE